MSGIPEEVDMTNVFAGGDGEYDLEFEAETLDDGSSFEPPVEEEAAAAEEAAPEAEAEEEVVAEEAAPEPEAEAEEEIAAEAETEEPAPIQVPKSRLDTEVAKRRALEEELAQYRKKAEQGEGDDIKLSEVDSAALLDAVVNGDVEKFNELYSQDRKQVAQDVAAALREEMRQNDDATLGKTKQQLALDEAAAEISSNFAVFDDNSSAFDETLTDELCDMRDFYISRGQEPAAALRLAANTITSREGLVPLGQEEAPAPAKPARNVKPDVQRKMKTAGEQPAELGGESNSSTAEPQIDIWSMSEADLERLPEKELAILRGDIVA